jgi:hypothetical protein
MMPERPLLRLPDPEPFATPGRPRGGSDVVRPSRDRQRARLDPRFEQLERVASDPKQILTLRDDPASIAPERAIVFEIEGSVEDFYVQARAVGLEYLGDFEEEFEPTDDFYIRDKPDRALTGRIYLAMPDVQALRELLSLWRRFKNDERMPTGRGAWRDLFSRLIDVRPWGPQDRVLPETIVAWHESLERSPSDPVRFEVELWFHENAGQRAAAFGRLTAEIEIAGGDIIDHAVIPEIYYDAALIDIPAEHIRALIRNPIIGLARADDVMFLRPQSVAQCAPADFEGSDGIGTAETPTFLSDEPIAALLDGLPIENHVRLVGRLRVDDPEGLAATYPALRREHGTEMASLIVHGDLNHSEAPLPRPLYVRPILQPTPGGTERTSPGRLLLDVIHQAVRRIKEGEGDEPPTAPGVIVINFSVCDDNRPFARVMSPLGRLLDYLAWRYRVLFLVSAGNITDRLTIRGFATWSEFEDAKPEDRGEGSAGRTQRPKIAAHIAFAGRSHECANHWSGACWISLHWRISGRTC